MRKWPLAVLVGCAALTGGCLHVKTDPIKVEPIHITMDIYIKVDRALDDFFAFEKQPAPAAGEKAPEPAAPKQGGESR